VTTPNGSVTAANRRGQLPIDLQTHKAGNAKVRSLSVKGKGPRASKSGWMSPSGPLWSMCCEPSMREDRRASVYTMQMLARCLRDAGWRQTLVSRPGVGREGDRIMELAVIAVKVKTLKRAMYGRAKLALLRLRVWLAARAGQMAAPRGPQSQLP
jgi:hypothetical protein